MKRYVNPNVHKNIIYKCQKRKQIKCSSTDEWMKKCAIYIYIAAFQSLSHVQLFVTHRLQHIRLLCPPLSPRVCSDSCLFSHWCYLTISSSAAPFFFCPQSFPASGSVPMMWLFTSGGQSIGASVLASVLPMNIQDWFHLALSGLIPLQSKGLSRVFSSTTIQKHRFFSTQPLFENILQSLRNSVLKSWAGKHKTFCSNTCCLYEFHRTQACWKTKGQAIP